MNFLYGMIVTISCPLPIDSLFYHCHSQGKILGTKGGGNGIQLYLIKFDKCDQNQDIPFTGYDREWINEKCLKVKK